MYNIYKFDTEEERDLILGQNEDKHILEVNHTSDGNYVKVSKEFNELYLIKEDLKQNQDKISILKAENADLLLDSAMKDMKLKTLESDLADLTLEVAMGGM